MQRGVDSMQRPTDLFKFSNDEGSVKENEYGLWASDPEYYDCGVVSYSKNFKVVPVKCDDKAMYMCEKKEEPCRHSYIRYIDYYGKCWLSSLTKKITSIYSSVTIDGGIYAGLQKKSTGEWVYENGAKETSDSRWDSDDDREKDCGVYRFKRDGTLALFSMDCDMQHRVLCVADFLDLDKRVKFYQNPGNPEIKVNPIHGKTRGFCHK
ncbi:c-type lectin domain-containing protein [Trichonephila clavata]|uniref:C-type lectin domain-containing protein n=1 Tax=Trichonephila clavata TaxID=2740835 RepID=A0A8X6FFZ5_TRICU|nr:c-type lectin domain-containing protein [Trichonephila clavata]